MTILKEDVIRLEKLTRLNLPEEKVQDFSIRLSKVFDWIDMLKEVSVENIDPMINPLIDFIHQTPMRQDIPLPTPPVEDILQNAPSAQNGLFLVPKMVE